MKKILLAIIIFSAVKVFSATTDDPTSTSTDLMATTTSATSSAPVSPLMATPAISSVVSTDTFTSEKTFALTVNDISEICGSSGEMPPARYWWIFVNSLTETGGSCGGGSFCSQTFTADTLSVNAEISLPPRSDYYVVGTFCSDNTANPSNPNGNFWSPGTVLPLVGDDEPPFDPIFSVSD